MFYYSSDRTGGELPLYNEDENHSGSSEMVDLPCSESAVAIRAVDLDNDGAVELVLMCSWPGEIFVLSLESRKSWVVNSSWALGDLNRATGWDPTNIDRKLACDGSEVAVEGANWLREACQNHSYKARFHGFQVLDLNNDGFLDAYLASSIGHQRFFINQLEETGATRNRFIRFELQCTSSNVHAIGTTLIFKASGIDPQMRIVSSFGYGNSRTGGIDDRFVFGLGQSAEPESLTVRWPSMVEQVINLMDLDKAHISNYSNPVIVRE